MKRAHLVHVHYRHARRHLLRRGVQPARLLCLPHPSYEGLWQDSCSREEARAALGLPKTGFMFGLVGAVRPYKGVPELIAAFGGLPRQRARLLLAGRQLPLLDLRGLPAPQPSSTDGG